MPQTRRVKGAMNVELVVEGRHASRVLGRQARTYGDGSSRQLSSVGTASLASWLDYTVNGLIIGNIYALLAVGLALIFGVSRLINFAHGSVYIVGAYVGWACGHASAARRCRSPSSSWSLVGALLGLVIERFGLRPLQGSAHIAPLLATIGISFVLDQLVQLIFSPDPRALPSRCRTSASRSAAARSARSTC